LTVQLGAPTIDSIKVVNISGNNLFVKDTCKWRVSVSDVNGKVKKIYAIWNGGLTPDDSIAVTISGSGYGEISHAYDTTLHGDRTVKFLVADEDSEMSTIKDTTIFVRKGAPVIYADGVTQDTIWVVIDSGVGRAYPVRINHADTNGTIVNYFWNEAGETLGRSTVTDTVHRNFGLSDVVAPGFPMWIYGRDDDGLTRGGKFIVYADSVPPVPVVSHNVPVAPNDSITIYWKEKDLKEGDLTEYLILLREDVDPDPSRAEDILAGWKTGYRISDLAAYHYMYRFNMPSSGGEKTYKYQILARDKRLSISKSGISSFAY
jgi:hypothetical protein